MIDSDSFSGFIFYLVIVSPALGWFLTPGRFSRNKGLAYSIGFLVALASINIGLKISEQNANFYQILGVSRDCSPAELKRAYRVRSVEVHPDKNPSASASNEFSRLRVAFDVLSDTDKKVIYDMFGEKAALSNSAVNDSVANLVSILSFYVVWGIMAYLLTLGDNIGNARSWTYIGGLAIMILEMNIRFAKYELPISLFPKTTSHEVVLLLQSILPAYMNGCRAIGGFLHVDIEAQNFHLGIELLKSNRELQLMVHQLHVDVQSKGKRNIEIPNVSKTKELSKRSKFAKASSAQPQPEAGQQESNQATQDDLLNPTPNIQAPPTWKIPGFVWAIAFYAVINWLFK